MLIDDSLRDVVVMTVISASMLSQRLGQGGIYSRFWIHMKNGAKKRLRKVHLLPILCSKNEKRCL